MRTPLPALLMLGLLCSACQGPQADPQPIPAPAIDPGLGDAPRLVVVLVVDQMRADYLTRFADQFEAGLARLLAGGAIFDEARQDHAITATAPGHAAIATGRFPSNNGIVGNDWWDRRAARAIYSAADPDAPLLADIDAISGPGISPRNLLHGTLGDWLKERSPDSRVMSFAIKDRSAALMGGRRADGAFWYHPLTGRYITSAYYHETYPIWVSAFNASGRADRLADAGWTRLLPLEAYGRSREDTFAHEADGRHTTFPHDPRQPGLPFASVYEALANTPLGDRLTLEAARLAVEREGLGADPVPDLLWISASSADLVGHAFGPFSQEVQDYYLRLDRMLGEWLTWLDERIGANAWVLALTSDHGVLPFPEELQRRGVPSARIDPNALLPVVQAVQQRARDELGLDTDVPLFLKGGVVFGAGIEERHLPALRAIAADELRRMDFVADAYTWDELADPDTEDRPFLESYRRSFHRDRAADVMIRFPENHFAGGPFGTTHGSPYDYDTRVPLVFYGRGVARGRHGVGVRTVDVAPTLARLIGLDVPPDVDGRVLEAALAPEP